MSPVATLALVVLVGSMLQADARSLPPDANAHERAVSAALATLSTIRKWEQPIEPTTIVEDRHADGWRGLHAVGTRGLGAWLFTTPEGHILLNTGMPSSGPVIVESLRKLQVNPQDIKTIIIGHAHIDHVGAVAYLKQLSGAGLAVMEGDVDLMESGGKSDFMYGGVWRVMGFPCAHVDQVLRDGEAIELGGVRLTARHTPGHTRGATTWVTQLRKGETVYTVVFPDGGKLNPGYRIGRNPSYPRIADDFRRTLRVWEGLKPDIWLSHHGEDFDFERKRKLAGTPAGVEAWIDRDGYRQFVADKRSAFERRATLAGSAPSGPLPAAEAHNRPDCKGSRKP